MEDTHWSDFGSKVPAGGDSPRDEGSSPVVAASESDSAAAMLRSIGNLARFVVGSAIVMLSVMSISSILSDNYAVLSPGLSLSDSFSIMVWILVATTIVPLRKR